MIDHRQAAIEALACGLAILGDGYVAIEREGLYEQASILMDDMMPHLRCVVAGEIKDWLKGSRVNYGISVETYVDAVASIDGYLASPKRSKAADPKADG